MNTIRETYHADLNQDYSFNRNEFNTLLEIIKEQGVPMLSDLGRYQKRLAAALSNEGAVILPIRCGENVWTIDWTQAGYKAASQVVDGIYIGADNQTICIRTTGSGKTYVWGNEAFHTKKQALDVLEKQKRAELNFEED